jgi:ACS family tartrate transporter-like MFS transporter
MAATVRSIEDRTIARASARLVPFLILCFFVAYLDRVNVGFAALTMNRDLGLSSAAYGFGAGVFFITYSLFEVPSNLLLERVGARRWIARIMLTWGILSGATAVIQGETSFYAVRMLLGIAEAGFFPGIIFYLTLWFPAVYRARIIGAFLAAVPLATVIGAPVSGLLLGFDGVMGLRGWQWLFLLEAVPALILSVVVFFYLTDRPADATWLAPEERTWLVSRLRQEQQKRESVRTYNVVQALCNPKVLALSVVYFGAVANNYGLSFFLPQIVKAFGGSNAQAGFVTAIPYIAGAIGAVWWGRHSDATRERRFHLIAALLLGSIGIAVSTAIEDPVLKIAVLCAAGFGIFGSLPVFWTLPTAFLGGAAAAGGIALINSIGNLAGFVAPFVVGSIKDATGGFTGGLLCVAATSLVAAMIVLVLDHDRSLEHAPDALLPEVDPGVAR